MMYRNYIYNIWLLLSIPKANSILVENVSNRHSRMLSQERTHTLVQNHERIHSNSTDTNGSSQSYNNSIDSVLSDTSHIILNSTFKHPISAIGATNLLTGTNNTSFSFPFTAPPSVTPSSRIISIEQPTDTTRDTISHTRAPHSSHHHTVEIPIQSENHDKIVKDIPNSVPSPSVSDSKAPQTSDTHLTVLPTTSGMKIANILRGNNDKSDDSSEKTSRPPSTSPTLVFSGKPSILPTFQQTNHPSSVDDLIRKKGLTTNTPWPTVQRIERVTQAPSIIIPPFFMTRTPTTIPFSFTSQPSQVRKEEPIKRSNSPSTVILMFKSTDSPTVGLPKNLSGRPSIKSGNPTVSEISSERTNIPTIIGQKKRPHHVLPPSITPPSDTFSPSTNPKVIEPQVKFRSPTVTPSKSIAPTAEHLVPQPPTPDGHSSISSHPTIFKQTTDDRNEFKSAIKTIKTSYDGKSITHGVMFDVQAIDEIKVIGLDIHTSVTSDVTYEIYTQPGTHENHEQFSSSWKIIASGNIEGKGESFVTPLPPDRFESVHIQAGAIQSFYVTLLTSELMYSAGSKTGTASSTNSDIIIKEGLVVHEYPFGINFPDPCIWNGVIHYRSKNNWASATVSPTQNPTASRAPTQPMMQTTFLFAFFLNHPSSKTFYPNVTSDIDAAIQSALKSSNRFKQNEVLAVKSMPVDIAENDKRCPPTSDDSDIKCGAINIYIDLSHLSATHPDEIRPVLSKSISGAMQEVQYEAVEIVPIEEVFPVLISLQYVNTTSFRGEEIAFFENVVFQSLKANFEMGLLSFEATSIEVYGDSVSPAMSLQGGGKDKSALDDSGWYTLHLETLITTRHFGIHVDQDMNGIVMKSLTADKTEIMERLKVNGHFDSVLSIEVLSMSTAEPLDIPLPTGDSPGLRLIAIICGAVGVVLVLAGLAMLKRIKSSRYHGIETDEKKSGQTSSPDSDDDGDDDGDGNGDGGIEMPIEYVINAPNEVKSDDDKSIGIGLEDEDIRMKKRRIILKKSVQSDENRDAPSPFSTRSLTDSIVSTGSYDEVIWRDDTDLPSVT